MKDQHSLWFYSQIYKEKYNITFTKKKIFINSKSELEIIDSYNSEDEKNIMFKHVKKNYADG